MADIWLGFVITVSGDKAYGFSVLCRELPASSSDLTRRVPLAYLFEDTRDLNSPPHKSYSVKVWDDFADPLMNERMKEIHHAAIRYGLGGICENPSDSELNLDRTNYEQWCNRPQLKGDELRTAILRFIYLVNRIKPYQGVSKYDLIDNFNASREDIGDWLNNLASAGHLDRVKSERYWLKRDSVNTVPFIINPTQRETIQEMLGKNEVQRTSPQTIKNAFLSYRTVDKKLAGQIKGELEKHGIRVFLAHDDIEPSFEWKEKILLELNQCDIFLPLLTDSFRGSEYTDQEAGIAFAGEKVILPLKVTQNPHGFIERFQALTVKPENVAQSCNKLIRFLTENHGFQSALDKDLSK